MDKNVEVEIRYSLHVSVIRSGVPTLGCSPPPLPPNRCLTAALWQRKLMSSRDPDGTLNWT